MKKNIQSQIFTNYFVMFFIVIAALAILFALLNISNLIVSKSLLKNRYTAEDFLENNYLNIDTNEIIEHGGGIIILDSELNVLRKDGVEFIDKSKLSPIQWANFLKSILEINAPFSYTIAYEENESYWLVVAFPTSLRMCFSVYINNQYWTENKSLLLLIILVLLIIFGFMLYIFTYMFTKISSKIFTKPVIELSNKLIQFKSGNYNARIKVDDGSELGDLANIYNDMASTIESEIENRKNLILDIAHDIKNPLASIMGYSEYLLNHTGMTNAQKQEHFKIIYDNSLNASRLTNDLFQLSKLEIKDKTLNIEQVDICELLREEIALKVSLLEQHGFNYEFIIPEKNIVLNIDKQLIRRVIDNLIYNAVKYNPPNTNMLITLEEEGKTIVLKVCDDGVGMDTNLSLSHNLSSNIDSGYSMYNHKHGSGLGLKIVEKIIKLHFAQLFIETSPEMGSKFIIIFDANADIN